MIPTHTKGMPLTLELHVVLPGSITPDEAAVLREVADYGGENVMVSFYTTALSGGKPFTQYTPPQ